MNLGRYVSTKTLFGKIGCNFTEMLLFSGVRIDILTSELKMSGLTPERRTA